MHWVVITLTLILRNLSRLQQKAESLGQRWAQEVKKRERKKQRRKRDRRRKLITSLFPICGALPARRSRRPWT